MFIQSWLRETELGRPTKQLPLPQSTRLDNIIKIPSVQILKSANLWIQVQLHFFFFLHFPSLSIYCLQILKLNISNLDRPNTEYKITSIQYQNHSSPQLILICWSLAMTSLVFLTLLIYSIFKSDGDFQFSHSNQFPGLARGANIDHRPTEPNYFNQIFLSENADSLPNCWWIHVYDAQDSVSS